jgi:hypothetical protein
MLCKEKTLVPAVVEFLLLLCKAAIYLLADLSQLKLSSEYLFTQKKFTIKNYRVILKVLINTSEKYV